MDIVRFFSEGMIITEISTLLFRFRVRSILIHFFMISLLPEKHLPAKGAGWTCLVALELYNLFIVLGKKQFNMYTINGIKHYANFLELLFLLTLTGRGYKRPYAGVRGSHDSDNCSAGRRKRIRAVGGNHWLRYMRNQPPPHTRTAFRSTDTNQRPDCEACRQSADPRVSPHGPATITAYSPRFQVWKPHLHQRLVDWPTRITR